MAKSTSTVNRIIVQSGSGKTARFRIAELANAAAGIQLFKTVSKGYKDIVECVRAFQGFEPAETPVDLPAAVEEAKKPAPVEETAEETATAEAAK